MPKTEYISELPKDATKIKEAFDYIDPRGIIYGVERRNNTYAGQFFIKKQTYCFGYRYCAISYLDGRRLTSRVHRLVASAFIPNPQKLPIVLHKDNNKANNVVENLKWGTVSENTQQAFDDGLAVNRKGFDDEQSIPVDCYGTLDNHFIGSYGSVCIASRELGMSKKGITYQLENPSSPIRKDIYFVKHNEPQRKHSVIGQFDMTTDEEVARFINTGHASRVTGIADSVISNQVLLNRKPHWTHDGTYFREIDVL